MPPHSGGAGVRGSSLPCSLLQTEDGPHATAAGTSSSRPGKPARRQATHFLRSRLAPPGACLPRGRRCACGFQRASATVVPHGKGIRAVSQVPITSNDEPGEVGWQSQMDEKPQQCRPWLSKLDVCRSEMI